MCQKLVEPGHLDRARGIGQPDRVPRRRAVEHGFVFHDPLNGDITGRVESDRFANRHCFGIVDMTSRQKSQDIGNGFEAKLDQLLCNFLADTREQRDGGFERNLARNCRTPDLWAGYGWWNGRSGALRRFDESIVDHRQIFADFR